VLCDRVVRLFSGMLRYHHKARTLDGSAEVKSDAGFGMTGVIN
jgi:hypothetical protein